MAPKVLFVLTSHNRIDALDKPTGWYLPEFAHPYYKLAPHCDITVASPAGGEAPLDPSSVEAFKSDAECQKFLQTEERLWKNTQKLDSFQGKAANFDAIFFVGGHGPMYDLYKSPVSQSIIAEFYESNKVVSAVCHGPAAFLNVKLSDGTYMLAGQDVTAFSNIEEDQVSLSKAMPFMLETELKKHAKFVPAAEPWGEQVVLSAKHSKLLTGQNPASAGPLAETVLKVING